MPPDLEAKIIDQCNREGTPLPKKIAEAPELALGLELYFDAFNDLSSCRSVGWGLGPIPWSAMLLYANDCGLDGEGREELYFLLRKMDAAWLDWHAKKSEKDRKGKTGGKFK